MTSPPPDGPGPVPSGPRRRGLLVGRRAWASAVAALALIAGGSALTVRWQDSGATAPSAASRHTAESPTSRAATTTPSPEPSTALATPSTTSPTSPSPTTTTPSTSTAPRTAAPRTAAPRATTTTRTTAPAPATTKATTPPTTPPPPATTPALEVLRLTNVERAKAGCAALSWNAKLASAAQAHSTDMRDHNYFAHNSLDGRTPFDRIKAAGYTYHLAAENIAAGQPTAAAVVQAWMASSGHRANILNCGLKDLGVGYAAGGSYGSYWTQDFGTP